MRGLRALILAAVALVVWQARCAAICAALPCPAVKTPPCHKHPTMRKAACADALAVSSDAPVHAPTFAAGVPGAAPGAGAARPRPVAPLVDDASPPGSIQILKI